MKTGVTINRTQRLYVIPEAGGYSCLGFDVLEERAGKLAAWLGDTTPARRRGTLARYRQYREMLRVASARCLSMRERCPAELTPQLIGLEGKRVEVTTRDGARRRFWVGKSTGWLPVHLEVARRDSSGGPAVSGAPFFRVRVVREGAA